MPATAWFPLKKIPLFPVEGVCIRRGVDSPKPDACILSFFYSALGRDRVRSPGPLAVSAWRQQHAASVDRSASGGPKYDVTALERYAVAQAPTFISQALLSLVSLSLLPFIQHHGQRNTPPRHLKVICSPGHTTVRTTSTCVLSLWTRRSTVRSWHSLQIML